MIKNSNHVERARKDYAAQHYALREEGWDANRSIGYRHRSGDFYVLNKDRKVGHVTYNGPISPTYECIKHDTTAEKIAVKNKLRIEDYNGKAEKDHSPHREYSMALLTILTASLLAWILG